MRLPDDKWNLTFCYVDPLFSYLHFPSGSTLTGGVSGLKEGVSDFLARVKVKIYAHWSGLRDGSGVLIRQSLGLHVFTGMR